MYSLDIINMTILAYNKGIKIIDFIKRNNTNYTTFYKQFWKYNEFFIKNIPMTGKQFKILIHNIYINQIKDFNIQIQLFNILLISKFSIFQS